MLQHTVIVPLPLVSLQKISACHSALRNSTNHAKLRVVVALPAKYKNSFATFLTNSAFPLRPPEKNQSIRATPHALLRRCIMREIEKDFLLGGMGSHTRMPCSPIVGCHAYVPVSMLSLICANLRHLLHLRSTLLPPASKRPRKGLAFPRNKLA